MKDNILLERIVASIRGGLTPKAVIRLVAGVVGAWVLLTYVLPQLHTSHTHSGKWESPGPVLLLGLIIGMTYGLLAVGLVLIYSTNRLIIIAHACVTRSSTSRRASGRGGLRSPGRSSPVSSRATP